MPLPSLVVSMTTYPARLSAAVQTLKPLFHQTVPPDVLELWLAGDEFDTDPCELVPELKDLVESGLSIRWCKHSLGPHNKYFWAMQTHPDDIVITIDDDVIYTPALIQSLLELHYRHPNAVVANRTHTVCLDELGDLAPYDQWVMEQTDIFDEPRHDLIATGVGGVLYPPHIFGPELFDEATIRKTCLLADDLWLFVHELEREIPVVNTWASSGLTYIPGSQENGLYIENLENGRNDRFLSLLFERYPKAKEALIAAVEAREGLPLDEFELEPAEDELEMEAEAESVQNAVAASVSHAAARFRGAVSPAVDRLRGAVSNRFHRSDDQ